MPQSEKLSEAPVTVRLSRKEKEQKALKEIFSFYARLHQAEIKSAFQDLLDKQHYLDIGEYMLFCRDFKLPIKKPELLEVFKKTSEFRNTPVDFSRFSELCDKLGKMMLENEAKEKKK